METVFGDQEILCQCRARLRGKHGEGNSGKSKDDLHRIILEEAYGLHLQKLKPKKGSSNNEDDGEEDEDEIEDEVGDEDEEIDAVADDDASVDAGDDISNLNEGAMSDVTADFSTLAESSPSEQSQRSRGPAERNGWKPMEWQSFLEFGPSSAVPYRVNEKHIIWSKISAFFTHNFTRHSLSGVKC